MKSKSNEWVSIADLMSGVMAVVMLLLVISVLQKTWSEIKHKQELEAQAVIENESKKEQTLVLLLEREKINQILNNIQTNLHDTENESLVMLDINSQKITLKDGVFNRGSACITPQAKYTFSTIENQINIFLSEFSTGQVFIEGHTDNVPVSRPVINYEQFCTVYDDNFTLSAARAREARKLMVNGLDDVLSKRVTVAGYGDSQPLDNISLDDARQRRIEIRFVIRDR